MANIRKAMAAKNINPAAPQIRGVAANQLFERATTKATSGTPINCPVADACTKPALINVRTDGAADSRGIATKRELGTKPDTKDNRADAASRSPIEVASANARGDKSRLQGNDEVRACASRGEVTPTVQKEGSVAVEQASVTRFPPLLGGSSGASGAIIPKQLQRI